MKKSKDLIILAIETSCDDTCIAILKIENYQLKILSNVVSSQVKLHKKYGGIYPMLAKREHMRNLAPVFIKSLKEARLLKLKIKNEKLKITAQKLKLEKFFEKYEKPKVGLIAVTIGPGLEPCLWTGINFAKDLAKSWNLPIVPVNHIEAHILANWLMPIRQSQKSKAKSQNLFPAVCLIVSGGHSQLILMKDFGKYKILGETRDDAAGECFDKCARILGLGYPGGPAIAEQAQKWKFKIQNSKFKINLPRPMIYQKNYDFSFSGLKTAVLYNYQKQPIKIRKSKKYIQAMAAEIQQAIIDVLIHKTLKAAKDYKIKSIILGGGVAANEELRKQFNLQFTTNNLQLNFLVPPKNLSIDNAVMVGITAYFHSKDEQSPLHPDMLKANASLRIK